MKKVILSLILIAIASCNQEEPAKPEEIRFELGKKLSLYATMYYVKEVEPSSHINSVPLRDMSDNIIGPKLDRKTWCLAAMEGTVKVGDAVYNYAGTKRPTQTKCEYTPSEKVRWKKTDHPYGVGNRNNPLRPFKSIATDTNLIPSGSKVFIPEAKGVEYEFEGETRTHDGVFYADDVGGKIRANHIDVFLGVVEGGLRGALKLNPFDFIKSDKDKTFEAYLIK